MPTPGDRPIITVFVAVLFVLGLLSQGWLLNIRDFIKAKVSEA